MNRRTCIAIAILATGASVAVVGCNSPKASDPPRGYSTFRAPKMPPVPAYVPTPLNGPLQLKAIDEIAAASKSSDEVIRAQSLEALSRSQDRTTPDRIERALADPAWLVRFAGAMAAGDLKLQSAKSSLLAASVDANPNVRVATRYALHKLGDQSRTKDLETLSQNPDPRVRANVAMVIGMLGEPTGVRVVRPLMADTDFKVRIEAAEALWRLGDEQGLKNLVAATISHYPDDVIVGILALAAPRDQRVKDNIIGKLAIDKDGQQYVELQLVAARAAGMLGGDEGYGVAINSLTSKDPRQRALAALALGEIGRADAQSGLARALEDSTQEVRLSAAVALRQIELKSRGGSRSASAN